MFWPYICFLIYSITLNNNNVKINDIYYNSTNKNNDNNNNNYDNINNNKGKYSGDKINSRKFL